MTTNQQSTKVQNPDSESNSDIGPVLHKGASIAPESSARIRLVATVQNTSPTEIKLSTEKATEAANQIKKIADNIEKAILGKRNVVESVLIGLLARGHVLIEDVPGVGKSALAKALAKSVHSEYRRIQFTPDLLPSDLLGVSVYNQKESQFKFHPGPLFAQVILADEINRTTPRTQAALLEAMNDFHVSIDGVSRELPRPFMVLATQNPLEYTGTYPLPEAQLDRFLLRLSIGYPDRAAERKILRNHHHAEQLDLLKPVLTANEVVSLQKLVRHILVSDPLVDYILDIAAKTRTSKELALGVSVRGEQMLYRAAQAKALIAGRNFCIPDDIKSLAPAVLVHRLIERGRDTAGGGGNAQAILRDILEDVAIPV